MYALIIVGKPTAFRLHLLVFRKVIVKHFFIQTLTLLKTKSSFVFRNIYYPGWIVVEVS